MILAILQARVSSTRLPGKVLKLILGKPMLSLQLERIKRSKKIEQIVVATSTESSDDVIETLCQDLQITCYRGSLDDVLERFYKAALKYLPEHVVRLTGDCPLIDPQIIDDVIDFYLSGDFDYVSNSLEPTFPDGLDVEVFSFSVLEIAWHEAVLPSHREHVTPFIHQQPDKFKIGHYKGQRDLSLFRWTVDEAEDFELVNRIYEELYPRNVSFTTEDILNLLSRNPSLVQINCYLKRNEKSIKEAMEKDRMFLEKHLQSPEA